MANTPASSDRSIIVGGFLTLAVIIFFLGVVVGMDRARPVQPEAPHPEYAQAQRFLADLYPGRRFRILWSPLSGGPPMIEKRRHGQAIPLDEPRFPPIPFYCFPNRAQEPCFLDTGE